MKRTIRRQIRTEAMRKVLNTARKAYKDAINNCVETGVSVTTDATVDKAYDRLNYIAKELAQAQYTKLCAKEDAQSWVKFCDCLRKAGLMYSPAYWEAHSAFSGQRYWAIQNWRNEKMR